MILQSIIDIIESVAPLGQQEAWDNSGLQVGDTGAEIEAALLTTDVTEAVVAEAIERGCNLIVSHHPLIFHGLRHLTGSTPQERCVERCLRHGIAVYSTHTPMDKYAHGVSGRMAQKIGITDYRILVEETPHVGLGVIGTLPEPLTTTAFVDRVAQAFGADYVRYTLGRQDSIATVALCGGAGAEFLETAIAQGADAYVSADFKYHEMQAADRRIVAVDMDHWVSEHFTREIFSEMLKGKVKTFISTADKSPIKYSSLWQNKKKN